MRSMLGFSLIAVAFATPMQLTQERSASGLVAFLLQDPTSLKAGPVLRGLEGCGQTQRQNDELKAARALVLMGDAAVPDLEAALRSLEAEKSDSARLANVGLLLHAYAAIKGPAAHPVLFSMLKSPRFENELDDSIALSLHLTSYVSSFHEQQDLQCRRYEPRDAINRLILAWWNGDANSLCTALGPTARSAVKLILIGKTLDELKREYGGAHSVNPLAVGYRISAPGAWSEPEETLLSEKTYSPLPPNPDLVVTFTSRSGHACGVSRMSFLHAPARRGQLPRPFVIDNSDIGSLLKVITSCAAQQ